MEQLEQRLAALEAQLTTTLDQLALLTADQGEPDRE